MEIDLVAKEYKKRVAELGNSIIKKQGELIQLENDFKKKEDLQKKQLAEKASIIHKQRVEFEKLKIDTENFHNKEMRESRAAIKNIKIKRISFHKQARKDLENLNTSLTNLRMQFDAPVKVVRWQDDGIKITSNNYFKMVFTEDEVKKTVQNLFKDPECKEIKLEFNNQQLVLERELAASKEEEDKAVPKKIITKKEVKKINKKITKTKPKSAKGFAKITWEKETEIIRENRKKPGAFKPHKFKNATWTHKNGHPRCLICGDEEVTEEALKKKKLPKGWCEGREKEFTERSVQFKFKDFTAKGGMPTLLKDLKFPYRVHSVGFGEGFWHKTFYPWDVIKKSANKIVGSPFVIEHKDGFMEEVGEVTDFKIDDKKKWMEVFGYLYDTEPGKQMAVLHANQKIPAVSVRLQEWTDVENGREVCKEITGWPHVAFVRSPEVTIAKIIYDKKSAS